MSKHTDIAAGGWVSHLPAAWRPFALLARLDRPIGAWLLFLPGLWSFALRGQGLALPLLFAGGSVLMRGAGCVVNDLWDRDLDRKVARTAARPLASGVIGLRAASGLLAALLTASLLILLQLNRLAQQIAVASLVLVALYPLAKRVTWWPQLMLGVTFGWGALVGYAAATGRIDRVGLALYGAAIAWILGYDTIYAHQDRDDDSLIGVRSTARLFAGQTRVFLAGCYGLMLLALGMAAFWAGSGFWFWPGLAVAAIMLGRQIAVLDVNDPAGCLRLFQANRQVGLVVALALWAGRL